MKIKNRIRPILNRVRKPWGAVFAIAFIFAMHPSPGDAECVQIGTEVICTGPSYSNSYLMNRKNPLDNVEVFTIDGRDAPVIISRDNCISGVSLISDAPWEKNTTVNLKGDVSITSGWKHNSSALLVSHYGNDGSIFINTSSRSFIETTGTGTLGGNHGIYGFIGNETSPGNIDINASGDIFTAGKHSYGIFGHNKGRGNTDIAFDGNITTEGDAAHGIYALQQGSGNNIVDIGENAVILATGADAHGMYVQNDGEGDNTVAVAGTITGGSGNAYAIAIESRPNSQNYITIENTAAISAASGNAILNTTGDSSITVEEGAWISGAIHLGDGSDDLAFNGTDISGITVMDGGSDTSKTDDRMDTLTFNNVTAERAGADTVNWEVIKIDQSSTLKGTGKWRVGETDDTKTGIWIKNGSVLHISDGFHLNGNLNIGKSAALVGGGSSYIVTGLLNNTGAINLDNGSAADTLTVQGDYHGDDGQLHMDTYLGGDGSATDRLIVSGDTSGNTDVFIYNAGGGGGAQTLQGIEIISVGGTSAAEHFELGNSVEAGAYEYFLFRGKPDEENDNFYLRSQFVAPDPDPDPDPDPEVYRPAVAGYMQGQTAMQEMGYAALGSRLHRRVGEQQTFKWDYCGCDAEKPENHVWLRMAGQYTELDGRRQFGYEQDMFLVQVGKDIIIGYGDDLSHRHTGLMLSYGRTEADFHDRDRRDADLGRIHSEMTGEMYALGAYHTRYAQNGFYQDIVGQVHHNRNRYTDKNSGGRATQNGTGFGLSAETGRPWQIADTLLLIEPQAQLSYQLTRYSDFSDNISDIDDFTSQSLRGRIGARLAWNDRIADTERTKTVYLAGNILHDFIGPETIRVGGDSVREKTDDPTWGELGLHGQYRLTDAAYGYASANYQKSIGGSSREGYGGQLGVRIAW